MGRIYGERIMLREYKKEDLDSMRRWVNNPEIVDNLSDIFLYPHTVNSTEEFLNNMLQCKSDIMGFVVADIDTEEYIGQIDLVKIDWKNRVGEMGIVIGCKENLGQGYGKEAIKLFQKFVFESLNLNRLELKVHDYNTRARKCYVKCGFEEEGRIRQCFYKFGKYTDHIIMGILKNEYEYLKDN